MSRNISKPGTNTGKPVAGTKPTPGGSAATTKGPDPKHLPREFK